MRVCQVCYSKVQLLAWDAYRRFLLQNSSCALGRDHHGLVMIIVQDQFKLLLLIPLHFHGSQSLSEFMLPMSVFVRRPLTYLAFLVDQFCEINFINHFVLLSQHLIPLLASLISSQGQVFTLYFTYPFCLYVAFELLCLFHLQVC